MPAPSPLAPFDVQLFSRAKTEPLRRMPSPRLDEAVHPWIVLPVPTSKPIPVEGVKAPAPEMLEDAEQAVIVQPPEVVMPDEDPAVLVLRKALQWLSDDRTSAKMPIAQLLFDAVQLIRVDPTPAAKA